MNDDIGAKADPTDPGARLLVRIGDFIAPLTRFDRSHLSMMESRHDTIDIMVRQVFRAKFETQHSDGNGALPAGVHEVADAVALSRETEALLAASRVALPQRLAGWAEAHGDDPRARPSIETCFAGAAPVGYVAACAPCRASGQITCQRCGGAKELTCATCAGRGAKDCETCRKTGEVQCQRCRGMGTLVRQKHANVWDEAAGRHRLEYVQESQPCPACDSAGKVKCPKCAGRGELTCKTCDGRANVMCPQCKGQGSTRCETCDGQGKRYHTANLSCSIDETQEVSSRDPDTEIVAALKGGIEDILQLSAFHRATAEAGKDALTRDTLAAVPVTSVVIAAGEKQALIRALGERQLVRDYRNIAGLLMSGDLTELEAALPTTKLLPPRVNDALFPALATVLESEVNVAIAKTHPKRSALEIEREHRGAIAAEYVKRAGEAVRKGLGRAYWAGLARGPALVMALPFLFAPLDLFLRSSGVGVRVAALLAVIALTIGGATAGHWWAVRQLQKKLGPDGLPKIAPVLDAMGLTTVWLAGAGVTGALLTLLVAGITSTLFPAG